MTTCEIIIVGGGSAGCTLAHLLQQRYGYSLTLCEPEVPPPRKRAASPQDTSSPKIDQVRPARWLKLLGSPHDWGYTTAAAQSLSGRALSWPRGRGLGGSSRINAMIWFPPTEDDLHRFSTAAADPRWSIEALRAAYQVAERLVQPESARWISEPAQRFLQAAGPWGDAIAYRRMNRDGRRWTPAALLARSPGVHTARGTVDRILFRNERAIGVQLVDGLQLFASKQVILCAGSIATPAILMRSGIGPRDRLRDAGGQAWLDAPGVGQNLQDHLVMPVIFATAASSRFDLNVTPGELARFDYLGRGPLSSNIAEAGGLFNHDEIQIHVTPTHYLRFPHPEAASAMTIAVNATKPRSRGEVTIGSLQASDPPQIDPNYLADPRDLETTLAGVELARSIARESPLRDWLGAELLPGSKRASDRAIGKAIARYAQTLYHPVGTCGLGEVVDANLAVIGTERLSVVDASVFPELTRGNPNAMVLTLAALFANQLAASL